MYMRYSSPCPIGRFINEYMHDEVRDTHREEAYFN